VYDIIDSYSEVDHSNISFQPVTLTSPTGTFFNSGNNVYLNILPFFDRGIAASLIYYEMNNFLSGVSTSGAPPTTRNFFTIFVNNVYNDLKYQGGTLSNYANSTNFNNEMSLVYKDLLVNIRNSMLDTAGNIVSYSLGNEIAKLSVNLSYQYISR
jgi:hypothetical protein